MCFEKGIAGFDLIQSQNFQLHSLGFAHTFGALEFLHARVRMGQSDRAGDMVIHRIIHSLAKPAVKFCRIALHIHHRPRGGKGGHIARRMPGAARRQFVFFQQNTIAPAGFSQMIKAGRAHGASSDDNDACC